MKRTVSDLLDSYRDDTVELELRAPLSSQRIKELTMSKVKKIHKVRRFGVRLLVAAAIISALTMTAFAAETIFNAGDIIRSLFRGDINDSQVEVMNELGGSFQPQTVTSEGTTMTLAAAYGDTNTLYLYFQVEGPEGTVLPDGIIYDFYDYNDENWNVVEIPKGERYDEINGVFIDIEPLPDDDPEDNRKEFYVTMSAQMGQKAKFNDGVSKLYNITGIYEQVVDVDQDEDGYQRLVPGSFTFDIGLVNEIEMVELDVKGLTYGGSKSRTWTCGFEVCGESCEGLETNGREHTEYWDYSVTAKSLKISPLSAEWECEYEISDKQRSCELEFQIFMKDGTSPGMYGVPGGGYNDTRSFGASNFTTPIDLSEIDYILIGDPEVGQTHKVYLPKVE